MPSIQISAPAPLPQMTLLLEVMTVAVVAPFAPVFALGVIASVLFSNQLSFAGVSNQFGS